MPHILGRISTVYCMDTEKVFENANRWKSCHLAKSQNCEQGLAEVVPSSRLISASFRLSQVFKAENWMVGRGKTEG